MRWQTGFGEKWAGNSGAKLARLARKRCFLVTLWCFLVKLDQWVLYLSGRASTIASYT